MASDKKPIIFSIDDDPQVLRSLRNDLRNEYKNDYRIISTDSPQEALQSLPELKKQVNKDKYYSEIRKYMVKSGIKSLLITDVVHSHTKVYKLQDTVLICIHKIDLEVKFICIVNIFSSFQRDVVE